MARDRQRAKQRRRRRSGTSSAPGDPAGADSLRAEDIGLDDDTADSGLDDAQLAAEAQAAEPLEEVEGGEGLDELESELVPEERGSGQHTVKRPTVPGSELPQSGNRFVNFLRASAAELRRVQWPDRKQVAQATAVVLGFVVVAGGFLGLCDALFSRLVNAIL